MPHSVREMEDTLQQALQEIEESKKAELEQRPAKEAKNAVQAAQLAASSASEASQSANTASSSKAAVAGKAEKETSTTSESDWSAAGTSATESSTLEISGNHFSKIQPATNLTRQHNMTCLLPGSGRQAAQSLRYSWSATAMPPGIVRPSLARSPCAATWPPGVQCLQQASQALLGNELPSL